MSDFNRSAPVEWGLRAYLLLTFADSRELRLLLQR